MGKKTKEYNIKYFNFPIVLLEGFLIDHISCLSNILDYAIYAYCDKYTIDDVSKPISFYHIKIIADQSSYQNGKLLFESISDTFPKVGIKTEIFEDFFHNEKTEFQKVVLLAFLSIKSILQNKTYCKIDNKFLFARMDGKAKAIKDCTSLSKEVLKYYNEYQAKKIKMELILGWNLIHYSRYTRGFYVSFKLTLDELIFQAEKKRRSRLEKNVVEEEKQSIKRAIERLSKL